MQLSVTMNLYALGTAVATDSASTLYNTAPKAANAYILWQNPFDNYDYALGTPNWGNAGHPDQSIGFDGVLMKFDSVEAISGSDYTIQFDGSVSTPNANDIRCKADLTAGAYDSTNCITDILMDTNPGEEDWTHTEPSNYCSQTWSWYGSNVDGETG